jgi:hypothetical protein
MVIMFILVSIDLPAQLHSSPGRKQQSVATLFAAPVQLMVGRLTGSHTCALGVALVLRCHRDDGKWSGRGKHKLAVRLLAALHGMNHVGRDLRIRTGTEKFGA